MSLALLQAGFGVYTALVAAVTLVLLWRFLPRRAAAIGCVTLLVWLAYAGAIGALGLLRDPTLQPPGIVYLALPALAGIALTMVRGRAGLMLAAALPLWLPIGLQSFRVGVEAALHGLWEAGLVPRLMTLAGGNVESVVAFTAPLAAWLATRGASGRRVAWAWNLLGALSLLNVVIRGVLTAPGPLDLLPAEVPNLGIGQLPFSYIPGFMVPLAAILHVLAFRSLHESRTSSKGAAVVSFHAER